MKTKLRIARRITVVTVVAALCSVLAYGVGWAVRGDKLPWEDAPRTDSTPRAHEPAGRPGTKPIGNPAAEPSDTPSNTPSDSPSDSPSDTPSETPSTPAPPPKDPGPPPAGPALLSPGDTGPEVRDLQARLKQIAWFTGDVTDKYGPVTTEAIRGFQAKRGFEVTGEVDRRTLDRLHEMTRPPTQAELTNQPPPGGGGNTPGPLDARCTTGRVLCIDKSSRTLRWVVDGQVRKTVDVRFGSAELPTREGVFSIQRKSRDHVSTLYHTSMPYAMFFSGGQAVHYSPDFAAHGYNGASHGCVNVRDQDAVAWLFDQVTVGDRVVIYWS
ncbi:murein L,D-transpeptidase [Pimelobacter simplex]|uniref:Murein L,D-transpeptidase n=1 Tax=Nocardioides simplex TaxID=2045 RepID=A0A7J5DT01_NOCSI|nr:L,D-transpeptidase family protein [Pimelobacter simplex]KAB2808269.1 murein L,D-transpeptidase [Pimelobacter simplex]